LQLYISFKKYQTYFLHFNANKYEKALKKMANSKTRTLSNISKSAWILEIKTDHVRGKTGLILAQYYSTKTNLRTQN